MRYQLPDGNAIVASSDFIAKHYPDAVLIEEPEAPPVIAGTTSITMRQARLYLHQKGMLEQVDGAISELDGAAQIEWQYASTVEIDWPVVQFIRTELGLSDEQVQTMFNEAAKL